jgi:putative protein-disulfide isomerase
MMYSNQEAERKTDQQADRISIVYYTDPLCCWSWALEPHWQRLITEFSEDITYSYCMGGMIQDWGKFNDPLNSVNRPVQMGPVWMEVKHLTGSQIEESIWIKDPPFSSYPACIAVKAAGLQSKAAEELYLQHIRQAVMTRVQNIARTEVLLDLAKQVDQQFPEVLDLSRFETDLNSEASREAFRKDLEKVRYHQIGRFPTITLTRPGRQGILITGYRPYEVLTQALKKLSV